MSTSLGCVLDGDSGLTSSPRVRPHPMHSEIPSCFTCVDHRYRGVLAPPEVRYRHNNSVHSRAQID